MVMSFCDDLRDGCGDLHLAFPAIEDDLEVDGLEVARGVGMSLIVDTICSLAMFEVQHDLTRMMSNGAVSRLSPSWSHRIGSAYATVCLTSS